MKSVLDLQNVKVKGVVSLQILDHNGNVKKEINDFNTATLWAKTHTPPGSLNLDLMFESLGERYQTSYSKYVHTMADEIGTVASGAITSAFTYTEAEKKYSISFAWSNSSSATKDLYGLVSYHGRKIYTVFDLSASNISIEPLNVVNGTYTITYDMDTPDNPASSSFSQSTISNSNTIALNLISPVSPEVINYKYSRIFSKTSEYPGCDTDDSTVESSALVTITSSGENNTAFDYNGFSGLNGELYYKITSDGQPNAAKAIRYLDCAPNATKAFPGAHKFFDSYYKFSNDNHIKLKYLYGEEDVADLGYSDSDYFTIQYKKIKAMRLPTDIPVKPIKLQFPSSLTRFADTTSIVRINDRGAFIRDYIYSTTPPTGAILDPYINLMPFNVTEDSKQLQFIAYLYWPNSPTLKVAIKTRQSQASITSHLFIDGVEYTPTSTVNEASYAYTAPLSTEDRTHYYVAFEYDISSLTAGSGIVIFNINDHGNYWSGMKMTLESTMYGYVVPYAGLITNNSGEIMNWISSSCINYDGTNQEVTNLITTEADAAKVDLVQNVNSANVDTLSQFQYGIWVTEANYTAGKIVGNIEEGNEGDIVSYYYRIRNSNYLNNMYERGDIYVVPIYVDDQTGFHFLDYSTRSETKHDFNRAGDIDNIWRQYANPVEDYYKLYISAILKTGDVIDISGRSLTLNSDEFMALSTFSRDPAHSDHRTKFYLMKTAAQSSYDYVTTKWIYADNTTGYTIGSDTYLFENTIQSTENIADLTLTFQGSSVFVSDEFFSFPINDNPYSLIIDSLETWKLRKLSNVPSSEGDYDSENVVKDHLGTDDIIVTEEDQETYRHFIHEDIKRDITLLLPETTMKIADKDFTDYYVYMVIQNSDVYTDPHLYVPKYIGTGATRRYVNIESLYLTDGMHIIPWSIDQFGDDITTEIGLNERKHYWTIFPHKESLKNLYPEIENTGITLYAYFIAKQKSELLDFEVEVYNRTLEDVSNVYTKINLPFCVDRNIDVTDEDDTSLDFLILDDLNHELSSDVDCGNVIFVKMPSINAGVRVKEDFRPITQYDANGILGNNAEYYKTDSFSDLGYDSNRPVISNTKEFENCGYVTYEKSTYVKPGTSTIKIVSSETPMSQSASSFLSLYIVPSNILTLATAYNVTEYNVNSNSFYFSQSTKGLYFDIPTDEDNFTMEFKTLPSSSYFTIFCNEPAEDYSATTGVSFSITGMDHMTYRKLVFYRDKHKTNCYNLNGFEGIEDSIVPDDFTQIGMNIYATRLSYSDEYSDKFIIYNTCNLISIIAYDLHPFITNQYSKLPIAVYPPDYWSSSSTTFKKRKNFCFPIHKVTMGTEDSYLYTTNNTITPLENAGPQLYLFKSEDLNSEEQFKVCTYATTDLTPLRTCYSNSIGNFIFTQENPEEILVFINPRTKKENEDTDYFKFVKNSDLQSILSSGYKFDFPISYIDETYANSKYTSLEVTPLEVASSTIVLLEDSMTENVITKVTTRFSEIEQSFYGAKDSDVSVSYKISKNTATESLDNDPMLWSLASRYELSSGIQSVDSETTITKPISLADSQLLAKDDGKRCNLVFDDTQIPVEDITRLGMYSLHGGHYNYKNTTGIYNSYPTLYDEPEFDSYILEDFVAPTKLNWNIHYNSGSPVDFSNDSIKITQYSTDITSVDSIMPGSEIDDYYIQYKFRFSDQFDATYGNYFRISPFYIDNDHRFEIILRYEKVSNVSTIEGRLHRAYANTSVKFSGDTTDRIYQHTNEWFILKIHRVGQSMGVKLWLDENEESNAQSWSASLESYLTSPTKIYVDFYFGTSSEARQYMELDSILYLETKKDMKLYTAPMLKIIDETDSSEKFFCIDPQYGVPKEITPIVSILTNDEIDNNLNSRIIGKFGESKTFAGFNSLLSQYNNGDYKLSIGFLVYTKISSITYIHSLSMQMELNDTSHYSDVDWCYVNIPSQYTSNTKSAIVGDVSSFILKVYNPNDVDITNYTLKLDVEDYSFGTFSSGIVAVVNSIRIPTLYEAEDGSITTNMANFNGKGIWVKIELLTAGQIVDIELTDYVNSYTALDLFNFYDDFTTLDTSLWDISYDFTESSVSATEEEYATDSHCSERVLAAQYPIPLRLNYNNQLEIMYDDTDRTQIHGIAMKNALSNDLQYEIKFHTELQGNTTMYQPPKCLVYMIMDSNTSTTLKNHGILGDRTTNLDDGWREYDQFFRTCLRTGYSSHSTSITLASAEEADLYLGNGNSGGETISFFWRVDEWYDWPNCEMARRNNHWILSSSSSSLTCSFNGGGTLSTTMSYLPRAADRGIAIDGSQNMFICISVDYDNNRADLYVDGELADSITSGVTVTPDVTDYLRLGFINPDHRCAIAVVRVYDQYFNKDQVDMIYLYDTSKMWNYVNKFLSEMKLVTNLEIGFDEDIDISSSSSFSSSSSSSSSSSNSSSSSSSASGA